LKTKLLHKTIELTPYPFLMEVYYSPSMELIAAKLARKHGQTVKYWKECIGSHSCCTILKSVDTEERAIAVILNTRDVGVIVH